VSVEPFVAITILDALVRLELLATETPADVDEPLGTTYTLVVALVVVVCNLVRLFNVALSKSPCIKLLLESRIICAIYFSYNMTQR
jgi:hypothetical protein